jgi:hypothetical protein
MLLVDEKIVMFIIVSNRSEMLTVDFGNIAF